MNARQKQKYDNAHSQTIVTPLTYARFKQETAKTGQDRHDWVIVEDAIIHGTERTETAIDGEITEQTHGL